MGWDGTEAKSVKFDRFKCCPFPYLCDGAGGTGWTGWTGGTDGTGNKSVL